MRGQRQRSFGVAADFRFVEARGKMKTGGIDVEDGYFGEVGDDMRSVLCYFSGKIKRRGEA